MLIFFIVRKWLRSFKKIKEVDRELVFLEGEEVAIEVVLFEGEDVVIYFIRFFIFSVLRMFKDVE